MLQPPQRPVSLSRCDPCALQAMSRVASYRQFRETDSRNPGRSERHKMDIHLGKRTVLKRGSISAKKKKQTPQNYPAQFAKTNREPFSSMERMVAMSLAFGFSDEARGNPTFFIGRQAVSLAPHPSMASERVPIPKKARIAFTIFI